jgi:arylsulfatase A-like enzyme
VPVGGGMHGGLNRHELNTVLIVRGGSLVEGTRNPAPAGIVDIAPTILEFLGIERSASMIGRSLLRAPQDEPTWRSYETGLNGFGQMLQVAACGRSRHVLAGARTDLGSNR